MSDQVGGIRVTARGKVHAESTGIGGVSATRCGTDHGRIRQTSDPIDCARCVKALAVDTKKREAADLTVTRMGTKLLPDNSVPHPVTVKARDVEGHTVYTAECEHGWGTGFYASETDAVTVARGHGAVSIPLWELPVSLSTLPQIPGYTWQWHNPQGGQPVSTTCIQLMRNGRTLPPAAKLHRNSDGTWHAETGHSWGPSACLAGSYSGSLTVAECANAVAAEAAKRCGFCLHVRPCTCGTVKPSVMGESSAYVSTHAYSVERTATGPVVTLTRHKPSLGRRNRKGK